jgi:hypothetical protein
VHAAGLARRGGRPLRHSAAATRLVALYRQLRKAQEDAKNQPGAADFYYGEKEMWEALWLPMVTVSWSPN